MWTKDSAKNLSDVITKMKNLLVTINDAVAEDLSKKAEGLLLQHKHAATLKMPVTNKTEEVSKALDQLIEAKRKAFEK